MDKFERFVVDSAFIERSNGNTPYAEIIYRLHYLENIMEKYKCFTPQDLDQRIVELEEENKRLKLCKDCEIDGIYMLVSHAFGFRIFHRPSRKGVERAKMSRKGNREVLEFMVGCVIPKDLNDRAQAKCKAAGTTLYDAILTFIKALADGEVSIKKKELNQK